MDNPGTMPFRTLVSLAAGAAVALGVSACGSAGSAAASRPVPPAPIVISVLAGPRGVSISPVRVGAGPVLFTVTNQGGRAVSLTVVGRHRGRPVVRTGPLNPQGVTQLKLDLGRGTYTVSARPPGRATDAARTRNSTAPSATLRVGARRPSAGDQVLEP
jgi:hypothetical protein